VYYNAETMLQIRKQLCIFLGIFNVTMLIKGLELEIHAAESQQYFQWQ